MRAVCVRALWLVPVVAACSSTDPAAGNAAAGVGGTAEISAGSGGAGHTGSVAGSSASAGAAASGGIGSAGSPGDTAGLNPGGGSNTNGGSAVGGSPGAAGAVAQAGSLNVAGSSGALGAAGAANPGGPSYPFVFSVFNDAAAVSSLQIYTSTDALNFKLLLDTGFGGPTGNLRDPSIMKHSDGKFYVAFTTPPAGTGCCGAESSFSVASSADLKKWTTIAKVASGVPGTVNTWAPEWFKDKDGIHILASIDKKTYRYEPKDATLTQFGGGTWIGIGPDYIDTFIVTVGATYHAFTKRESTRYIEHATATSLDGPWTFVGTGDWAKWGTHREAGALIQLDDGTWRFYCDGGSAGHEMYSDSSDTFKTWTPIKGLPNVGSMISHGTVIRGN